MDRELDSIRKAKHEKMNADLMQFFDIKDEELQIPITFPTVSALVDNYFYSMPDKMPFLSVRLFEQLNQFFPRVPLSMKMCLNVTVADPQGYTSEQVVSIIEAGMNYYRSNIRRKEQQISSISAFMFTIGCLMLILGFVLMPRVYHVIYDIIYISGTFFIWDAGSRLLVGWLSQRNLLKKWKNLRIEVEFAGDKTMR